MAHPKQLTLFRWLFLLPIPLLWILVSRAGWIDYVKGNTAHLHTGWLGFLENRTLDWRFRARGEIPAPVKVVYVDIDSSSIGDLGELPWDRGYYAEVSDALLRVGRVKAIGLDIVLSEKGRFELMDAARFTEGNRRFANLLFSNPPIVLAATYAAADDRDINGHLIVRKFPEVDLPSNPALQPPKPEPPEMPQFRLPNGQGEMGAPNVGLIDTIDRGTRWVHLFAPVGKVTYENMAVELARLYWDLPPSGVKITADTLRFVGANGKVRAEVPLAHHQDLEVNWFSPWSSPRYNPRASFADVLVYARLLNSAVPAEKSVAEEFFAQFHGAVVLIGPVDPLRQDLASTPLDAGAVPRVGIHGNILKTIVSGIYLHRIHFATEIALLLLLTAVVLLLAVGAAGRAGGLGRIGAFVLLLAYAEACFFVFSHFHWVLPMTGPLAAAFTTSFVGVLWQLAREEKQKGRIKLMFGTYVSPALVDRMIDSREDPKLGGAELQITAYFSDIQDFSAFSERLSPTQLVVLMNEYLTACTDIITAEGGTLDKYIGDAVVAMFGAPVDLSDHAYRACIASQKVQLRLGELREKWASSSHGWPDTVRQMRTRIGLNSGAAVVGNMGSHTRFNYTMMGDSVNLAARLESGAKTYGVTTLVTEVTKDACELHGKECLFRFLDRIVVKGRSQPVAIYELVGLRQWVKATVSDGIHEFETGMSAYLRQNWDLATAAFQKAAQLEKETIDAGAPLTPAKVYLERCALLKEQPPRADWDGVWVMRSK